MKKTAKQFYQFFEAIGESRWCMGSVGRSGVHCALGHLGATSAGAAGQTDESRALLNLFGAEHPNDTEAVYAINDNSFQRFNHLGTTPKQRILNALRAKMLQPATVKEA